MARQHITHGRIVFVSSFISLATFAGYGSYGPGKAAVKGESDRIVTGSQPAHLA